MTRAFARCLILAAWLAPGIGSAQVTLDLKALDQPSAPPAQSSPPPRRAPRPLTPRLVPAPSPSVPPAAALPTQAPPIVRLAPDVVSPTPAPPAPAPPVTAEAPTSTAALPDGLRVVFGPGSTDLSPSSDAAIASLAGAAPQAETVTYDVRAYAAGKPEEPSTARRLSLARALAVRASLMARGIPSARIYVRALGGTIAPDAPDAPDAPPDRADVTLAGADGARQTAGAGK